MLFMDIDTIMDMLDWNNSPEIQAKGVETAKDIKSINVFLQPVDKKHNKNVWDNCAEILCKRKDDELNPYLINLLEWTEDLTWPGAMSVFDRIISDNDDISFELAINRCIKKAEMLDDNIWLKTLIEIKTRRDNRKEA